MGTEASIAILQDKNFACIRIVGRANLHSSVNFKTAVAEMERRGCRYFILDLSQCSLMDSTFLGVLAGLGLKTRNPEAPGEFRIELLNPNARITELLETLGILHLFRIEQGAVPACGNAPAWEQAQPTASNAELNKTCLEAHKLLSDMNPENAARFKDVVRFLAEDLAADKSHPPG